MKGRNLYGLPELTEAQCAKARVLGEYLMQTILSTGVKDWVTMKFDVKLDEDGCEVDKLSMADRRHTFVMFESPLSDEAIAQLREFWEGL